MILKLNITCLYYQTEHHLAGNFSSSLEAKHDFAYMQLAHLPSFILRETASSLKAEHPKQDPY